MPPVRTSRNRKPPPAGFDDIEDTLLEFSNKMKDAENASHDGKKKHEMLWPIFQISHQKAISKQLYEWLLKNNYADANLIAKWKKQGYEKVTIYPFPTSALPYISSFCHSSRDTTTSLPYQDLE
ncbi:cell cycle control protein Cwf14 [Aspergillus luchuensis]|uniref:Cell cycle control protein Cwf14 n=1 Tax=Aspergillus kawachii TaxID=1069201 RepID=A0A146FZ12_ASPKA|nr:cell cycle control protein Cwf14 [Aspergillus luchuensis]